MEIRPIHNEAEYDAALAEIDQFFEHEPKHGTPDGDRFEILLALIGAYEQARWSIEAPDGAARHGCDEVGGGERRRQRQISGDQQRDAAAQAEIDEDAVERAAAVAAWRHQYMVLRGIGLDRQRRGGDRVILANDDDEWV